MERKKIILLAIGGLVLLGAVFLGVYITGYATGEQWACVKKGTSIRCPNSYWEADTSVWSTKDACDRIKDTVPHRSGHLYCRQYGACACEKIAEAEAEEPEGPEDSPDDGNTTCVESDGGTDYYKRGCLHNETGDFSDFCDGNWLIEHSCSDGTVYHNCAADNNKYCQDGACMRYLCSWTWPQGFKFNGEVYNKCPWSRRKCNNNLIKEGTPQCCKRKRNGVYEDCIDMDLHPSDPRLATCTESDGGTDYAVRGCFHDGINTTHDYCFDNELIEWTCDSGDPDFNLDRYDCAEEGKTCEDGACV